MAGIWLDMSAIATTPALETTTARTLRIGSVSFLNAKPLIWGLEGSRDLDLSLAVPSKLLSGLKSAELDIALLPVIDYQAME